MAKAEELSGRCVRYENLSVERIVQAFCLKRLNDSFYENLEMNFGASHLIQTSALLKKDSKRHLNGVLTLHAAHKACPETYFLDCHASPRSEVQICNARVRANATGNGRAQRPLQSSGRISPTRVRTRHLCLSFLQASKGIWGLFSKVSDPTLPVQQDHYRQYEAAAESIIEQLREALELTAEDLRRQKPLKTRFERLEGGM